MIKTIESRDIFKKHPNFVVVGSVDHGKSTLIGRLLYDTRSLTKLQRQAIEKTPEHEHEEVKLAFLADHLKEERSDMMTIDTCQIFLRFENHKFTLIDTPGHKEFLRNMVTGASRASAAILLLDVCEGICAQTRRHIHVLMLLGIREFIVVINKMDAMAFSENFFIETTASIRELFTSLHPCQVTIIPASALHGDNVVKSSLNMVWYDGPTIIQAMCAHWTVSVSENLPLRLPIQDCYEFDNQRFFAGKIVSGKLWKHDFVVICPKGIKTQVESIDVLGTPAKTALAGQSIAIKLKDSDYIGRGDIICHPISLPEKKRVIHSLVFWMHETPLQVGEKIIVKLATQEFACRVDAIHNRINSETLLAIEGNNQLLHDTEIGIIELTSERVVAYDDFECIPEMGRLVVVRDKDIAGAGIVKSLLERP